MIHEQFQGQQPMGQHGTMNTTFELRDAAIDRTKKRLGTRFIKSELIRYGILSLRLQKHKNR